MGAFSRHFYLKRLTTVNERPTERPVQAGDGAEETKHKLDVNLIK